MRRIGTFVFVVLFAFASASPAGAQSIRESAERLARQSAAFQPGAPVALRARSMVRTWAGVGLVAGRLALMFTGQDECENPAGCAFHFDLSGTVGRRSVDTFIAGGAGFTGGCWVGYGDARPIERMRQLTCRATCGMSA